MTVTLRSYFYFYFNGSDASAARTVTINHMSNQSGAESPLFFLRKRLQQVDPIARN